MLTITQEQIQQLLEGMNVGFILLDADFRVAKLNTEALRLDGRKAGDTIGRTCWEAWPTLQDSALGTSIAQSMADRATRTLNHHFAGATAGEIWLEMRLHPFGEGLGVYFRDVTDKMVAERALQAAQERYQLAARATNDIIWDFDIVANDIEWNEAVAEFLGCGPTPLHTPLERWADAIHPDDRGRVTTSLRRAFEDGSAHWAEDYRLRKAAGGYATVYDRGFIMRGDQGEAVRAVGAILDLTEIRTAERKVQQLQSDLIHVSRVSAMGTMASTLAHELNQPLTAVSSYISGCQRLVETGGDQQRLKEGLQAAKDSALRAGDVIRRLRAMIERGEVDKSVVGLRGAVEEAIGLLLVGSNGSGLTTRIEIDPDLTVDADPIQLQQVILNLSRNAIEAMENSLRKELTVRAWRDGGKVAIALSDTGGGIADELKNSLFEPFISTRESGMGIGLSISRTIIEAHRGRIWAEGDATGGTTFCITLPVERGDGRDAVAPGVPALKV